MKKELDKTTTALCSLVFGIIGATLNQNMGYHFFTAIGVVVALWHPSKEYRGLTNIFRQSGLGKKLGDNEDLPKVIYKKDTDGGFEAGLSLPVGLSSKDFIRKKQAISEALNADVNFEYRSGKVIMTATKAKLETSYKYNAPDLKGTVEIPVGYSLTGFRSLAFGDTYSNLLVGGVPGSGKSAFLRQAITYLITNKTAVKLHLIDLKAGVEFAVFRGCQSVESFAVDEQSTLKLVNRLEKMALDRYRTLQEYDCVNIKDYNKKHPAMDYHLVICDEYANLRQFGEIQETFDKLLRLCRAVGIYIIVCTQRPSADTVPGTIKANIQATLAFRTRNGLNSRILLDSDEAADLKYPGRGILQTDSDREVQVMYLSDDDARELVKPYKSKPANKKTPAEPSKQKTSGVMSLADYERFKRN